MMFFDRYGKLKKQAPGTAVHAGQKELLPLLSGSLRKEDLPELIVEPSNAAELQTVLRFAAERQMRIAVASGQSPAVVRDLEGSMLVQTQRLTGPMQWTADGMGLIVNSGTPLEQVAVETAQRGMAWPPLHPLEPGETMATFFARALEGMRCHRGGTLANIRRIEWVGFDGERYATGPGLGGDAVDVSPLLFGAGARFGILTKFELALERVPESRTLLFCECESVEQVQELQLGWRYAEPFPTALPFWTAIATNALRQGNDNFIGEKAHSVVACEWDGNIGLEIEEGQPLRRIEGIQDVQHMWQNLFRLPRTLTRLFPYRRQGRYRLPAEALCDFDERVRELAHDRGLSAAVWGTLGAGYVHVWVLHPDSESRTARQAADMLDRLAEDALNLHGCPVESGQGMFDLSLYRNAATQGLELAMTNKCDPSGRHRPLRSGV